MILYCPLPSHGPWAILRQFVRFGCVGIVGFVLDYGSAMALHTVVGFKIAVLLAYLIGATGNWCLNRLWTFSKASRDHHTPWQQWQRFLIANIPGFVVNRTVVLVLTSFVPFVAHFPIFGFLCGTLCGMFLNFFLSRRCVFNAKDEV